MKYTLAFLAFIATTGLTQAQLSNTSAGLLLGGGYLEDPGKAYGFGQFRFSFYEDSTFTHTAFLEVLGHFDDATLEFIDSNNDVFLEDGDINFFNFTANYELEVKLNSVFSVFAGGGVGVEVVSVEDRFDVVVDDDANFVAQIFAGIRADFQNGFFMQAGARYIFRKDFTLQSDRFVANDTAAFELGAGFQF